MTFPPRPTPSQGPTREPWQVEGFTCAEFYTEPFKQVTIIVRQVPLHEIPKYCGGAGNGCFDRARGIITVPRIMYDNDYNVFRTLGHEVWHALGGRHKGGI